MVVMLNSEVFQEYSKEGWVIKQNLCYMLQEFCNKYCKEETEKIKPCDVISFVEQYLQEETKCNLKVAEQSKVSTLIRHCMETIVIEEAN